MQLIQRRSDNKHSEFALGYLKGKIGQAIVETYLIEADYEIYPFGYETSYANSTRFVKQDYLDTTTTKIRCMPDLLVCDKTNNERYLLEIKTTSAPDESRYWIQKESLDSYKKYWPEAILVVYCILTGNIRCSKIADIKDLTEGLLPNTTKAGYYLNLTDFQNMTTYFRRIEPHPYDELRNKIAKTITDCGGVGEGR